MKYCYILDQKHYICIYFIFTTDRIEWEKTISRWNSRRARYWSFRTISSDYYPSPCRVRNLSLAMGRGIDSRNRVWIWVAKLHKLVARYDNPMSTWFLACIAGLLVPSLFSSRPEPIVPLWPLYLYLDMTGVEGRGDQQLLPPFQKFCVRHHWKPAQTKINPSKDDLWCRRC